MNPSSFNRTIVELKHYSSHLVFDDTGTFNRTIVELKPFFVCPASTNINLLIEPLWN